MLQFFLIVFGFAPLVFLGLQDIGGWAGLTAALNDVATTRGYEAGAWTQTWAAATDKLTPTTVAARPTIK